MGHQDVVQALLNGGADPDKTSSIGRRTALHAAVFSNNYLFREKFVKLLLARGADPNKTDKGRGTPLHSAAMSRQEHVAQVLLDGGADPNMVNIHGMTPLHEAAKVGSREIVQLLLQREVDPIMMSQSGKTPMLDQKDKRGQTPLHHAAARYGGNGEVVQYLLDRGAIPNKKDKRGKTPLQHATAMGNKEAIQLLRPNDDLSGNWNCSIQ